MGDRTIAFLPLSPIQTWGGGFVLYASASFLWGSGSWLAGLQLASLVLAFVIGAIARDLRMTWAWSILAFCVTLLTIPWLPYALYGNPNYLGCALALALAAALAYEQWYALMFLIPGLVYTGSRGAIAASGVAGLIWAWRLNKGLAACLGLVAIAGIAYASGGRDNSLLARVGVWHDTILNATVFGSGWGSFYDQYWHFPLHVSPTEHMTGVRATHAYNDFLELVFELGIGSIPLWVLILLCMEGTDPRSRLTVWTFFILALTFFPLAVPGVGQAFALTLGHLTRSRHGSRTERRAIPAGSIRTGGAGA